ncbi:MAG: hypothetical protein KZQ83_00490 [gamma proteobacterium symbiont of Taylorina sp.]|nr:hypothetical protein [gamma proteobacterium symbiont of Taylorina sp.]
MKITLEQHPELKLAHEFIKKFPDAVIAGGVARDLLCNRESNDIDIFMSVSSDIEKINYGIHMGRFFSEKGFDGYETRDHYGFDGHLMQINVGNLDICLMTKDFSKTELIDSFDMVSSHAWMEPTDDGFEVKATDLFQKLNDKRILGIYRKKADFREDHIQRICDKYSDYLPLELDKPKKIENFGVEFIPDF